VDAAARTAPTRSPGGQFLRMKCSSRFGAAKLLPN
jgi:hypothetical protein